MFIKINKNIQSKKDVWKRQDGSSRLWEGERCGGFWVSDEHQGSLTIIFYTKSTDTVRHFSFFFLKCTLFTHWFPLAFVKRYTENIYSGVVLPMLHNVAPPLSEKSLSRGRELSGCGQCHPVPM